MTTVCIYVSYINAFSFICVKHNCILVLFASFSPMGGVPIGGAAVGESGAPVSSLPGLLQPRPRSLKNREQTILGRGKVVRPPFGGMNLVTPKAILWGEGGVGQELELRKRINASKMHTVVEPDLFWQKQKRMW